jgi:hypothetical protein
MEAKGKGWSLGALMRVIVGHDPVGLCPELIPNHNVLVKN